jgi:hypothetical protein
MAQSMCVAINGQCGFVEEIETAQFINSVNMISVMMGVKNSINFLYSIEKALLPEIGRGIDQNCMIVLPNQNRRAQALVLWIF